MTVYDVCDHVREGDDYKKGHQIFGQEESALPEKILATTMNVNFELWRNIGPKVACTFNSEYIPTRQPSTGDYEELSRC